MDMREKAHATYMILQSVECFNDDPEGVGKLLEALGEHRNIVLSGSDEQKIVAVGHALDSDEKRAAIGERIPAFAAAVGSAMGVSFGIVTVTDPETLPSVKTCAGCPFGSPDAKICVSRGIATSTPPAGVWMCASSAPPLNPRLRMSGMIGFPW